MTNRGWNPPPDVWRNMIIHINFASSNNLRNTDRSLSGPLPLRMESVRGILLSIQHETKIEVDGRRRKVRLVRRTFGQHHQHGLTEIHKRWVSGGNHLCGHWNSPQNFATFGYKILHNLIQAHLQARNICNILLWSRQFSFKVRSILPLCKVLE